MAQGETVEDVSFTPDGKGWAVVTDREVTFAGTADGPATGAAQDLIQAGHQVGRVVFGLVEVTVPLFPVKASRKDDFPGTGGHMETSVVVDDHGVFNAVTHIWEDTALRGFRGGCVVVFLDATDTPVWVSPQESLGVDGRWIGEHDRTVGWTATVPTSAFPFIRKIAIKHVEAPQNLADVIAAWLAGIEHDAKLVAEIAQDIATVTQAA